MSCGSVMISSRRHAIVDLFGTGIQHRSGDVVFGHPSVFVTDTTPCG
jgi:hypothetical protein